MSKEKPVNVNYYEILDLTLEATSSDIRRAYKKKALKCHPDKNPDNPKAAELFHQLTKALEVLLDESARTAYDRLLKAKEAAKLRHKALDEKRKKFKEDLEARERAAASNTADDVTAEQEYQRTIEQLQKEGADLVQDEIQRLQEEVLNDLNTTPVAKQDTTACQLKISWHSAGNNEYTDESLRRIFSKYGDVNAVALLNKKAIVEFKDRKAADLAVRLEVGFITNPLKVTYASSKLRKESRREKKQGDHNSETILERAARQADERRRLIEEIMKTDASD